jgi:hypothetical protein
MAFGRLGAMGGGFGRVGSGNNAAGAGAAVGGAALLADETNGFATDFTYASDASRVAVKVANATTSYGLDSFFSNTGTSPKQVFDVAGNLIWSPHNMFLNSAAPATQSVTTVVGQNYTVTVTGSGSMTGSVGASGVASAGAPLTFTATGASSTFTKAGSPTQIQMNRGAVATAHLTTTGTVRNGLAVDYDPVTHAPKGMLAEALATNLLLNNTALSTQTVTVTATAYTLSFFGTGTVTLSGVSTAGPLTGTGAGRVLLTFTPTAGSLTCTVTGTVSNAQLETGSAATSPIKTFAASVTRAIDNVTCLVSQFPWNAAGPNSVLVTAAPRTAIATTFLTVSDGTNTERYVVSNVPQIGTLTVIDNNVSQGTPGVAGTPTADTYYKMGFALATNDLATVVDASAASVDTVATLPTVTTVSFGGISTIQNACYKTLVVVPRRMTNVELQTKTA